MKRHTERRTILKGALGGLAALALPSMGWADKPAITPLAGRFNLLSIGGSNVLALSTEQGAVLVDSGAPGHTDALRQSLQELGDSAVGWLFNTHWHQDQTGSNEALGREGAKIIAHEKTRLRLSTDYYLPQEDRYHNALPEAARPTQSFYTTGSMQAGDEQVDYGYLQQAHTDGDIYIHFPAANILAVGDVASPQRDPSFDWFGGGWIGGRLDAQDLLLELSNEQTRIVPAYGPVMSRADLQAERDLMGKLYERMVDLIRQGYTARDMLEEGVMEGLGRSWEDPYQFLYDAHKGLWAHHNKLAPNIV